MDKDSGRETRVGKREKMVLRDWKWRRGKECFMKSNDLRRIGGDKVAKVLSGTWKPRMFHCRTDI